jgi:nifR3 family TIM-barrel protein
MTASQIQKPAFHVDTIPVHGDVILSPMDGISDWPFRSICRELGSAMSYTEFVSAVDIFAKPESVASKLYFTEAERPVAIQIYGDDPDQVLGGALKAQEMGPDIIDINMGCPSKSIANRGAGVGLMRTPLKIARIFRKLTRTLEVPVTGKIRMGWDDDCLNYLLIARIVEENGGKLLAVHGRTKVQGYRGKANWDAIAEVVDAVSIPVIGNGDVYTVVDIRRMMEHTGCVGVMIGRAAIPNPWIFNRLDREQVTPRQVRETMLVHLERNLELYGPELGLLLFRKYAARYLMPYQLPRGIRKSLFTCKTAGDFIESLDEFEVFEDGGRGIRGKG